MKNLYALLGVPGVGKSTFIRNASREIYGDDRLFNYVVSPDEIRKIVASPEQKPDGSIGISQKNEKFVWTFIKQVLDKKVDNGELIIVDATHSWESAISAYKKYSDQGYRIHIIDFSDYADLDEIKRRNRDREELKFVPENVIETMHERIKTIQIPGWAEVIKPEDFVAHFTDIKYNFDEFKSLTFIGDIHSCSREFMKILDANGINPKTEDKENAIILIGDYFDRGPDPVGTFRLLQKLIRNKWVLPLMGNHEEPLRFYRQFVQAADEYTKVWIKEFALLNANDDKELEKILSKQLQASYKNLDTFIEELKDFPDMFKAYEEAIKEFKIPSELKKDPETGTNKIKGTSVTTMKSFLLSSIKYTEVASLVKKCAQMFYADYSGLEILATHGGLARLPDRTTPTSLMVRGVGGYEDSLLCDESFHKNHPKAISIHGHRNLEGIPIQSTPGTYNINGDVDLGLRSVKFHKDGSVETTEISRTEETWEHYRKRQLRKAEKYKAKKLSFEDESKGIMQLFQDHNHVEIKKLPFDIAAINFTRKAFEKGVWDDITIKARGLFMAIDPKEELPQDYVIARGYQKFFNVGERFGFEDRDIRNMAYPLKVFEKANGYLGLLSVDNRDPLNPRWFISSKSTTEGDYAKNFKKMIKPMLTEELMRKMISNNVTLVFEVIDPIFDPHIYHYKNEELVLLDAIKNQISFEKLPFEELDGFIEKMQETDVGCRKKQLLAEPATYADYYSIIKAANSLEVLSPTGIEGFVIEDSLDVPNMFKVKTRWYSFWKYMRGHMHRITKAMDRQVKKGHEPFIDNSDLINLKKGLHSAEEIKVFNFLVEYIQRNYDLVTIGELSIVDARKAFFKK